MKQHKLQVDILMATYNGADFIEAQLASIVGQTYPHWKLYIHDDGSQDNTIELIQKWEAIDKRIQLINDGKQHIGAAQNFLSLLPYSQADFCMFCDQDDIWFDNKVEKSLENIQALDNTQAQLVFVDSYVWIPEVGIKGQATLAKATDLKDFLFLNGGTRGCLSIFNTQLRNQLLHWKGTCAMHDHLLQLFALSFGSVKYVNLPLMLYRNHAHNLTGKTDINIYELKRLKANKGRAVVDYEHFKTIEKFYKEHAENLSQDKQQIIQAYLFMKDKSRYAKLMAILKHKFSIYNTVGLLFVKVLLRPFIEKASIK
jgi:glycosyltransferase involved in cell wall biosynthesis